LDWLGASETDLALGGRAFTSPFQATYLAGLGLSSAGLAYYPLLGFGLLSFLLVRPRWDRVLPWLGLALLSAAEARAVPFFAAVAGPILAWNLQEFFAARAARMATVPHWAQQVLIVLGPALGLAFLACAWT